MQLHCPPKSKVISVEFASYGTPSGGCGAWKIGKCHHEFSLKFAREKCIGQNGYALRILQ